MKKQMYLNEFKRCIELEDVDRISALLLYAEVDNDLSFEEWDTLTTEFMDLNYDLYYAGLCRKYNDYEMDLNKYVRYIWLLSKSHKVD